GIAHAGWRGLAAGVLESLLAAMPVNPATLVAWFGPAISQPAYEVGPAVKEAFRGVLGDSSAACFAPSPEQHGHWMADLCALARLHLARAGVPDIYGGDHCTHSEPDRFFSYRRDGDPTGRMATLIWRS
ncbi:MAG: laccase domain-containing protein, partial [Halieaceae bacterium]